MWVKVAMGARMSDQAFPVVDGFPSIPNGISKLQDNHKYNHLELRIMIAFKFVIEKLIFKLNSIVHLWIRDWIS